ncbi:S8 family serine peptidase [Flavobacterium terrigena]|uniref:Subtilase family protein n=1 Tax=Flavobacterium terrigena TaxID=402734 RepID=A0A1H6V3J6_9FLAO|nr:S8 family serine peptidase [Flavobacterium terrigena]SEI99091.1 Subtilase family protein [Flavobacterium terrigena]
MKKLLLLFVVCISCKTTKTNTSNKLTVSNDSVSWYMKDYQNDKIPGISLEKWNLENKKKPKQKQIIVAVIDMQIDINHEDLKNQIWINKKEIPNNNIDDDNNGYVDDTNGWCFIGHENKGYNVSANFDFVRILREKKSIFENKTEKDVKAEDLYEFKQYERAKKIKKNHIAYYQNWYNNIDFEYSVFKQAEDSLKSHFKDKSYSLTDLKKLYEEKKINDKSFHERVRDKDKDFGALISYMISDFETQMFSFEDVENRRKDLDSVLKNDLSEEYNDRKFIKGYKGLFEKGYGNNNVSEKIKGFSSINEHGTEVSGTLAATRGNNIGINGVHNNIKIMPVVTSCSGDEHDYDIANAIYYAVDNGAKIINMSFSKWLSLHENVVEEAIKYAEKKNVLIVHSAGNYSMSIDDTFTLFPNDYSYERKEEFVSNFINVGAVTNKVNENLVSSFSDYGKINVDIFAPGDNIYTCMPNNKYKFDSGTSLSSPMVSGTAALIWLYYPELTAKQVKDIILESGTKYDVEVIVPGTTDKKVKFSELSKSGSVLNVYNAMQLAEKVSQLKS